MSFRRLFWAAVAAVCVAAAGGGGAGARETYERRSLVHEGVARDYVVKQPRRSAAGRRPLLILLHGGGGRAERIIERDRSEDRIVIAPQALDRAWAVEGLPARGRKVPDADDVGFVARIIEEAIARDGADPERVWLAGVSRGGMFAFLLIGRLERRIDKAVIFISSMPAHLRAGYQVRAPFDLMIMNGTEDALVPYGGGWGALRKGAGRRGDPNAEMAPVEQVARDFARRFGAGQRPRRRLLPDLAEDGCRVDRLDWRGSGGAGSVTLFRVMGGGHAIPSHDGRGSLPRWLVGRTCRDVDGFGEMERFFRGR